MLPGSKVFVACKDIPTAILTKLKKKGYTNTESIQAKVKAREGRSRVVSINGEKFKVSSRKLFQANVSESDRPKKKS